MSETEPNAKGPAKVQMSPEQMAHLGSSPSPEATPPEPKPDPGGPGQARGHRDPVDRVPGRPARGRRKRWEVRPVRAPRRGRLRRGIRGAIRLVDGVAHRHTPDPLSAPDGSPRPPASGPDVLLVLFDGISDRIAIREPGEGIHFGPS